MVGVLHHADGTAVDILLVGYECRYRLVWARLADVMVTFLLAGIGRQGLSRAQGRI